MRREVGVVLACLSLLTVCGCGRPAQATDAKEPKVPDLRETLVEGNTAFAVELYRSLRQRDGNLFLSPYSISTALAMTYAGARGGTAEQMRQALHFPLPPDRLHEAWAALDGRLREATAAEGCELSTANALWPQEGYEIRDSYRSIVRGSYRGAVKPLNYVAATEEARSTINTWVAEKTNEKIRDLIPQGLLTKLTRLVLTNAIYFKGRWQEEFDEGRTGDAAFWVTPEREVTVRMMRQEERFSYAEGNGLQILSLPYAGEELSMTVLLPERKDGLAGLEKRLSPKALADWHGKLGSRRVKVQVPRFKMTVRFKLARVLKELGMEAPFGREADFGGITPRPGFQLSEVVHKAFVEVNEEGTEAAAATAVVAIESAAPARTPVFRADHPFLFLIRHRPSGTILFMGRVVDPAG